MKPAITVVIPVKNESANIEALTDRIREALEPEQTRWGVLFVDDGSGDGTFAVIKRMGRLDGRIEGLRLAESVGQERAILAGLRHCSRGAVIVMDGDLQDPPELLGAMVRRWKEGCDVVLTKRSSRRGEGPLKRLTASLFYGFMRAAGIESAEGNFYLIDEPGVQKIRQLDDPYPLLRLKVPSLGTRRATLRYDRSPRRGGRSKYGYARMWSLAMDGITGSTLLPLRLGYLAAAASFVAAVAALAVGIFWTGVGLPARLILGGFSVTFLLLGCLTLLICLLGEYAGRLTAALRSPRLPSAYEDRVSMDEKKRELPGQPTLEN